MVREPFYYLLTAKWTGAFFFWLLNGFKGSYKTMLYEKYDRRNIWAGYIIQILIFGLLIYILL